MAHFGHLGRRGAATCSPQVHPYTNQWRLLRPLLAAAKQQLSQQQRRGNTQRDVLDAKAKDLETQELNLRKSIRFAKNASDKELEGLVADLSSVTEQLMEIRSQRSAADSSDGLFRDYTDREIGENLPEVLMHLLTTSFEMAEVIRRFVPQCVIVPVQGGVKN